MADQPAHQPTDPRSADPLAVLREQGVPRPVLADWRHRLDVIVARLSEPGAARLAALAAAMAVVVALAAGVALAVTHAAKGSLAASTRPAVSLGGTTIPMVTTTSRPTEVTVHAAGAVVNPGLYHLRGSPRVADLIEAAGGLAGDADLDRINLAAALSDGARLYVPRKGETSVPSVLAGGDGASGGVGPGSSGSSGPSGPTATSPLDLNTATAEQLDTLPGIGPATAAAIVEYRRQHGPFRSVDGLSQVRGIGPAKLEAIRGLVHV